MYTIPSREFLFHISLSLQTVFISRDLSHLLNSLADFMPLIDFSKSLVFLAVKVSEICTYSATLIILVKFNRVVFVIMACMYTVYIFPKFGKHIICSWKNNNLKINVFIQLEVHISIQEFSLFGGEQSFLFI